MSHYRFQAGDGVLVCDCGGGTVVRAVDDGAELLRCSLVRTLPPI